MSLRKEVVAKQLKVIDLLQKKTESGDLAWNYISVVMRTRFTGFQTNFFLDGSPVLAKISDHNFRVLLEFRDPKTTSRRPQIIINSPEFKPHAAELLRAIRNRFDPTVLMLDGLIGVLSQGTFKDAKASKTVVSNVPPVKPSVGNQPDRIIDLGDDD